MKKKVEEKIAIPDGIVCTYENKILTCKKDSIEISKEINVSEIELFIKENVIFLISDKINKGKIKIIYALLKHIKNMFEGLSGKYIYNLEACNVHFPMTLKLEDDRLSISNFLGEKTPRYAKILQNVEVKIKGQNITLISHDKEAAGQTAANLEKATKVKGRDRRIFQDGIFITKKPGDKK